MSLRTVLLLLIAVTAAGVTALYARNWLNAEKAALLASMPEEKAVAAAEYVLVANDELAAGSFVKADHLKWQPWPEEGILDSYTVKGKRELEDFVGTVVRTKINAGEPITDARVVHPGDRGFLAAVLDPGKRAVSVPVNATTGISGFVFPGDWVDVILTVNLRVEDEEGRNRERFFSETLIGDIRVLAIDQAVENADGEVNVAKTATLEVTPKQAEKIAIALEMGSLSLSLHSLAREQDRFSEVARAIGADPVDNNTAGSFTMDRDVYYMRNLFVTKKDKDKDQVHVLRGSEDAAVVSF